MGASVRPEGAGDRIRRNVEALRSQGASDNDVEKYLTEHEGLAAEPAAGGDPGSWRATSSSWGDGKPTPPKTIGLPKPDFNATLAGVGTHAKNALQGIPGAEAAMAAGDAAYNTATGTPTSYRQAYDQLESDKAAIPFPLRTAEQMLVSGKALGALLPSTSRAQTLWQAMKTGAKTGAGFGAADAALSAKPQSLADRALGTGIGAVAGGTAGALLGGGAKTVDKAQELRTLAKRVGAAPTSGAVAVRQLEPDIAAATKQNYGQAAAEGAAAGGTSPALAKELARPRIAKYVEMVRGDEEGAAMSDADVARTVYKLMSKQRRGLQKAIDLEYDAAKELEAQRLGGAMKQLKNATAAPGTETTVIPALETAQSPPPSTREAVQDFHTAKGVAAKRVEGTPAQQLARRALERHATENVVSPALQGAPADQVIESQIPAVMPSFPRAVAEKARMEGERGAFETAQDAAKRIMGGASISGKKQGTQSAEAFTKAIDDMTRGQAGAALKGTLGRAKEEMATKTINPQSTLFGTLAQALARRGTSLNRIAPFVRQLDQKAGNAVQPEFQSDDILRLLGILNAPVANP